jgi:acyl-CoA thioester hydrolase
MGIIHHANYIHWFEEARVDFMDQIGFSYAKATDAGIDFVLLGISCDYRSMVHFNDTVAITVMVTKLTPVRMTIRYDVFDAVTQKLCTTGESRHCFFDSVKKRPASLQKMRPELYDALAGCLQDAPSEPG